MRIQLNQEMVIGGWLGITSRIFTSSDFYPKEYSFIKKVEFYSNLLLSLK